MGNPAQSWLANRFLGIVRIPVAGERVPSQLNQAAAEGVTHPESLRQKDRNTGNTLESAVADIEPSETATEGAAAETSP
jgi:hypothetical protein